MERGMDERWGEEKRGGGEGAMVKEGGRGGTMMREAIKRKDRDSQREGEGER